MKKRFKSLLINFSVVFITTLIMLFILEIALRIFGNQGMYTLAQYPREMFDYSQVTLMRPGFKGAFPRSELKGKISINSKGMRDVERSYEKNGSFRILGIGDSFPFGHGVELEESYLYLFEQNLKTQISRNIEVIKAGVPGTGPQEHLNVLLNEGLKYEPDMLIFSFFTGNDIDDIVLPSQVVSETTAPAASMAPEQSQTAPKSTTHYKDFLRRNIHLYSFVVDRLKSIPALQSFLQKKGIASGLIGSYVIDVLKKEYDNDYDLKWAEAYRVFDSVRHTVEHAIILIVPTREQVDDERRAKALRQLGYAPETIDIYKPNRLLKAYCDTHNIMCIDLLDVFRERHAAQNKPLYFEIDPHFNAAGHLLASEVLYTMLADTVKTLLTKPF